MAIMNRCCCFDNVRSGSTASGVYSLISSIIYLAVWAFNLSQFITLINDPGLSGITFDDSLIDGIYAAYSIDIAVAAFLFIASIVLLVGVSQDIKGMLIPYMVAMILLIALQAIAWIIIFALIGLGSIVYIVNLIVWLLFTALNITCLICVISQYQELSEGRGNAV